jgi:hypothetical protein
MSEKQEFKLTTKWANGRIQIDWHTADSLREELEMLARYVTEFIPGETMTIERIAQ